MACKSKAFKIKAVGFGQRPRPVNNRFTQTENAPVGRWVVAVAHNLFKYVTVSLPQRPRFTIKGTRFLGFPRIIHGHLFLIFLAFGVKKGRRHCPLCWAAGAVKKGESRSD